MEVADFLNRDFGKYQLHFELSGLKHFIKFRRFAAKGGDLKLETTGNKEETWT